MRVRVVQLMVRSPDTARAIAVLRVPVCLCVRALLLPVAFDCYDFSGTGVIEKRDFVRVLRATMIAQDEGLDSQLNAQWFRQVCGALFNEESSSSPDRLTWPEFEAAVHELLKT